MGNFRRAVEAAHYAHDLYGELPHEAWVFIAAHAARVAKISSWPIDLIVEAAAHAYERRPRPLESEDDAFVHQLLAFDPEEIGEETEDDPKDASDPSSDPDPFL